MRKKTGVGMALVLIFIVVVLLGASWIAMCGIIKLITMCFGLTFNWFIATGIWLIMILLKTVFDVTVKNGK